MRPSYWRGGFGYKNPYYPARNVLYSTYRRYARYGGRGTTYSRSRAIARSSKAGTKKVQILIPLEGDRTFSFAANSQVSAVNMIRPTTTESGTGDYFSLTTSPTFGAYADLYDQCRIVGIRLKFYFGLGFTQQAGGYFTFNSCIDRTMMSEDSTNPKTAEEVEASSSTTKTTFTVEQRLGASRSYYASSILEKTTWWDCTVAANVNNVPYIPGLLSSETAFKPIVYTCVRAPATLSTSTTLPFRLTMEYDLEFRNPKLTISTASSKNTIERYLARRGGAEYMRSTEATDDETKMDIEDDPGTS